MKCSMDMFLKVVPGRVCQFSEWKPTVFGELPCGVKVADAKSIRQGEVKAPQYVHSFLSVHRNCKKVVYVDIENAPPKSRKAKKGRVNKNAEFMGFTPIQIDFLVNMVNDENWIGVDDTMLSLPDYMDYMEKNDILNRMQCGMMLTVLRQKGILASERVYVPEYDERIVYFRLTPDGIAVFERLLEYSIKNDRIKLFDPSMNASQLV